MVSYHAEQNILRSYQLESAHKIFVRNNEEFLYFGSLVDGANTKQWSVRFLDLKSNQLLSSILLPETFGIDIGYDLAFKIIGKYFYGVSSTQKSAQQSFYSIAGFQLGSHSPGQVQAIQLQRTVWDGSSTDSRWFTIDLVQCEKTGKMFLNETGKAMNIAGFSQRFCYRKEIVPFGYEPTKDEPMTAHIGDDRFTNSINTPIRWYNFLVERFIDIIRDPDTQTLRIRSTPGYGECDERVWI